MGLYLQGCRGARFPGPQPPAPERRPGPPAAQTTDGIDSGVEPSRVVTNRRTGGRHVAQTEALSLPVSSGLVPVAYGLSPVLFRLFRWMYLPPGSVSVRKNGSSARDCQQERFSKNCRSGRFLTLQVRAIQHVSGSHVPMMDQVSGWR